MLYAGDALLSPLVLRSLHVPFCMCPELDLEAKNVLSGRDETICILAHNGVCTDIAGTARDNIAILHERMDQIEGLAREQGLPKSANMILLGMAAPFLGLLSPEQLLDALGRVFARKGGAVVQANAAAFRLGLGHTEKVSK